MKTFPWVAALIGVMLFAGASASADPALGTVREEPAATLLLPYFEVDLSNPAGRTTRFWVNNASATAATAHVTIWTDLSVPVFAFDIYLTGFDMQRVDLRDVLNGNLPQTASAGQDPIDAISPKGTKSQDINFAACNGVLPPAPLSASDVTALRRALSGASSSMLGGKCGGRSSPGWARGYVTIDNVNGCSSMFPNDPSYFTGGVGSAIDSNLLWGDFTYANGTADFQGAPLVAIFASATDPLTTTAGNYTFYGRYVGWNATDHRAPLATLFAGRYTRGWTQSVVWRDPKVDQAPFTCGTVPAWYPMGQEGFTVFDEQEHPNIPITYPLAPQPVTPALIPFPAAAQKTLIGSAAFPVPFASGWIWYDLNVTVSGVSDPTIDPAASQSWVMTMRSVNGSAGTVGLVGGPATQLDSATRPVHSVAGH
ncbi:MAG TPA: hypothetical protein VFS34_06105 [Thermoanaerobaculia bacterium]|nr:hypothetical protein [Thermoanaerobaculia bacterium]